MKKQKVSLKKRFEHSVEEAKRGGGAGSVFDWSKHKGDVKFYRTNKYGRHKVIILPMWIKSKNNPIVKSGDFNVGDPDYVFEYWSHKGMGPAHDKKVICLNKMYGKNCPICNQRNEWTEKGKKKEADSIRPQQYAIYNVYDANDIESGIQVLDVSYSNFQKKMIREASDYNDGDPVIIGEPDDLKVIKFKSYEDNYLTAKFPNYESFAFEDCEDKIDPSIIDETISFDELLKIPTAEEVEKMLYGDDEDSNDKEESPKVKGNKNTKPEPKDDEEDEEDENENDSEEEETDDEEDTDENEEESEEEDSDDENEEDDEPPPKPKTTVKGKPGPKPKAEKNPCPSSHVFGKDNGKHDECDDCDFWDDCIKAKKKLTKK